MEETGEEEGKEKEGNAQRGRGTDRGKWREEEEERKRDVTQRKEHSQEVGKKRASHARCPDLNRHPDTEAEEGNYRKSAASFFLCQQSLHF